LTNLSFVFFLFFLFFLFFFPLFKALLVEVSLLQ
jgi:hypothetical protein